MPCRAAVPLGIIVVPGDSDLELCRTQIERLQEVRLRGKWSWLDAEDGGTQGRDF